MEMVVHSKNKVNILSNTLGKHKATDIRVTVVGDVLSSYFESQGMTANYIHHCYKAKELDRETEILRLVESEALTGSAEDISNITEGTLAAIKALGNTTEKIADTEYYRLHKTRLNYLELLSEPEANRWVSEFVKTSNRIHKDIHLLRDGFKHIPLTVGGKHSKVASAIGMIKANFDGKCDVIVDPVDHIVPFHEDLNHLLKIAGMSKPKQWVHVGEVAGCEPTAFDCYAPCVIRAYLLGTHHSTPIDFDLADLRDAWVMVRSLYEVLVEVNSKTPLFFIPYTDISHYKAMCEALDNDMCTPRAVGILYDAVEKLRKRFREGFAHQFRYGEVMRMAAVLGIATTPPELYFNQPAQSFESVAKLIDEYRTAFQRRNLPLCNVIERRINHAGGKILYADGTFKVVKADVEEKKWINAY